MIAQKRSPVGAGQKRDHVLNPGGKLGDRHISAAQKAVCRADDRRNGSYSALTNKEMADDGGKRRAEQHEQKHVEKHEQNIRGGKIPAGKGEIQKARARRDITDDSRDDHRGKIVSEAHDGALHRRDGKVARGARHAVLHHDHIRGECDRHTANRKQGRHEPSADEALGQRIRHGKPFGNAGKEAVAVNVPEKGDEQQKNDERRDQRGKKHALILKKQLGIASDKIAERSHLSSPPASFFPVTARNTSSILPFVIS